MDGLDEVVTVVVSMELSQDDLILVLDKFRGDEVGFGKVFPCGYFAVFGLLF